MMEAWWGEMPTILKGFVALLLFMIDIQGNVLMYKDSLKFSQLLEEAHDVVYIKLAID